MSWERKAKETSEIIRLQIWPINQNLSSLERRRQEVREFYDAWLSSLRIFCRPAVLNRVHGPWQSSLLCQRKTKLWQGCSDHHSFPLLSASGQNQWRCCSAHKYCLYDVTHKSTSNSSEYNTTQRPLIQESTPYSAFLKCLMIFISLVKAWQSLYAYYSVKAANLKRLNSIWFIQHILEKTTP